MESGTGHRRRTRALHRLPPPRRIGKGGKRQIAATQSSLLTQAVRPYCPTPLQLPRPLICRPGSYLYNWVPLVPADGPAFCTSAHAARALRNRKTIPRATRLFTQQRAARRVSSAKNLAHAPDCVDKRLCLPSPLAPSLSATCAPASRAHAREHTCAHTCARLRRFQFFAFTIHLHLTVYQIDMGEHYSISSSQNTTTNNHKQLLYSYL